MDRIQDIYNRYLDRVFFGYGKNISWKIFLLFVTFTSFFQPKE